MLDLHWCPLNESLSLICTSYSLVNGFHKHLSWTFQILFLPRSIKKTVLSNYCCPSIFYYYSTIIVTKPFFLTYDTFCHCKVQFFLFQVQSIYLFDLLCSFCALWNLILFFVSSL